MSWPNARLSEVAKIVTGKTPSTKEDANFGGDIPFVTPAELDGKFDILQTPRTLTQRGADLVSVVPKNSVLVCCIGSLGKVGYAGVDLATNQQINTLLFNPKIVLPRYGYYAARRLKKDLERIAPATTVKIVSKSLFSRLEIPIPPLEEQKRIASILDQTAELVHLRQLTLDKIQSLSQSLFGEMFGEACDASGNWRKAKIGDLIVDAQIGAVRGAREMSDEKPCEYLRMDSMGTDGSLSLEGLKRVDASAADLSKYALRVGDFLLNTRNSQELVGKTAVLRKKFDGIYNNNILRCRFSDPALGDYLDAFLRSRVGKGMLSNIKSGTTSVFAIYQKAFMGLSVPVPPKHLTEEFSRQIIQIEEQFQLYRESAEKLQMLSSSIESGAFKGEL
ncbi:restriction endonuclease subunit S [Roseibium sp.]|uniref:restriction endonuclease subunit S n=1 Tax=Roseibium sp. TaxID=1936156 RepID=UPI0039F14AE4